MADRPGEAPPCDCGDEHGPLAGWHSKSCYEGQVRWFAARLSAAEAERDEARQRGDDLHACFVRCSELRQQAVAERDELRTRLQQQEQAFADDRSAFVSGTELTPRVLVEVLNERERQERKGAEHRARGQEHWRSCADPLLPTERKLAILGEEYGEVAKALNEEWIGQPANLRDELIHTAAVAVAWAESLAAGVSGGTSAGSARPPDPDWKERALTAEARTDGITRSGGEYIVEKLRGYEERHRQDRARVAQLEEALLDLQEGAYTYSSAKVRRIARAVLAGGTPPPGEQTDAGDARGVVAAPGQASGGSE